MKPHDFTTRLQQHFEVLGNRLLSELKSGEDATINVSAEETLFIRFNGNRVRQNTDLTQITLTLRLQSGGRSVEQSTSLGGDDATDQLAVTRLLARCRSEVLVLPVDPNQVAIENHGISSEAFRARC